MLLFLLANTALMLTHHGFTSRFLFKYSMSQKFSAMHADISHYFAYIAAASFNSVAGRAYPDRQPALLANIMSTFEAIKTSMASQNNSDNEFFQQFQNFNSKSNYDIIVANTSEFACFQDKFNFGFESILNTFVNSLVTFFPRLPETTAPSLNTLNITCFSQQIQTLQSQPPPSSTGIDVSDSPG